MTQRGGGEEGLKRSGGKEELGTTGHVMHDGCCVGLDITHVALLICSVPVTWSKGGH